MDDNYEDSVRGVLLTPLIDRPFRWFRQQAKILKIDQLLLTLVTVSLPWIAGSLDV